MSTFSLDGGGLGWYLTAMDECLEWVFMPWKFKTCFIEAAHTYACVNSQKKGRREREKERGGPQRTSICFGAAAKHSSDLLEVMLKYRVLLHKTRPNRKLGLQIA